MPGLRAAIAVPVLVTALLLTGCTSFADHVTASGDVAIVGAVSGTVDDLVDDALADLEDFWAAEVPAVLGRPFEPPRGGYFSVDPDAVGPGDFPDGVGCGQEPAAAEGNAFYCLSPARPHSDSITYDRAFLAELADAYGAFVPALVMAHEFGHAVQARVGSSGPSIAVETQADCLAGVWTRWVADGNARRTTIRARQLDELLRGYLLLRDPIGTSTAAGSAHGSGFDRVSAFQEGFDSGPEACRDDFGPGRTFTQGEFISDEDFRNEGNAPFEQLPRLLEASLPEFWNRAFSEVFQLPFAPPAIDAFRTTAPSCAPEDRDLVYCPDGPVVGYDETDLARPVYRLGDFAVFTAVSVPYAIAARDQLGLSADDADAVRSAVCLTGWYSAQVFNQTVTTVQISPGDLDESVQFLLTYGTADELLASAGLTGFQLVDRFRSGFVAGVSACDVGE
jgi:predicted metalloprotease